MLCRGNDDGAVQGARRVPRLSRRVRAGAALGFVVLWLCLWGAVSDSRAAEAKAAMPTKKLPRMLDIGAKKCIPCKMMLPVMEELQRDYTESVAIEFIDVWENPDAAKPYGIRTIPTQIFYDASGKELTRHIGYISKEAIIKTFRDFGVEIKRNAAKGR